MRTLSVSLQNLVKISNRGAKTAHYMLGDIFEGKQLLWKKKFPDIFSDSEWKVFDWTFKKLPTFLEETFHGKKFPFKLIMSLSGLCRSFFRIFDTIFLTGCSKLHFSCPEEHVSWKILLSQKVDSFLKIGYGLNFFESLPEKNSPA